MAANTNPVSLTQLVNPLDPNSVANAYQLQRQQAYAKALQEQAFQPIDQGKMVGNWFAAPPKSAYTAKLVQMLASGYLNKVTDEAAAEQTKANVEAIGKAVDPNGPTQAVAPAQAASAALSMGAASGTPAPVAATDPTATEAPLQPGQIGAPTNRVGPTPQSAATMDTMTTPAPGSTGSPLNPLKINKDLAVRMLMTDPAKFYEFQAEYYKPTEFSRDLRLLPQGQQAAAVEQKFLPPVIARGSPVLTRGPNGQLQVDPASVQAIEIAARTKAPFDAPLNLNLPNGSTVQLAPQEWADYQKTGKLPLRFLPPGVREGIQREADATGQPGNVNIKVPQGVVGGQIDPQLGVSQSSLSKATDTAAAPEIIKREGEIYDKGTVAINKVAQNNKMIDLLPQITTGPINKQITLIKSIGNSLGLDLGDPSSNQEFENYAIQGALSAGKQIYGNRLTNQDVTTQIMSNPGASMTEKAIYQLLKYDNEVQQRHIQEMTAYHDYKKTGQDLRDFPLYFSQKFPFQGVVAPEAGGAEAYRVPQNSPRVAPASPGGKVDYKALYGIKAK